MISIGRLLMFLALEALAALALVVALLHGGHASSRWALLIAALAIALVARFFSVAIWLDATVFTLAIAAIAVADRADEPAPRHKPHQPPPVTFALPSAKVVAAEAILADQRGVVILLDPSSGPNKAPTYEPHRYSVVFRDGVSSPPAVTGAIKITVKRGANDATAGLFAAQLQAATKIVVFPPR